MAELKGCLEAAGYSAVKTLLSSGNVAFDAQRATAPALAKRIESLLEKSVSQRFPVTVRPSEYLRQLIASDPYAGHRLPVGAKRVVTFLHRPYSGRLSLPVELDGARILVVKDTEAFSAYVPSPRGPVFMTLIERTFGVEQTTRTWDTVRKCATA